MKYPSIKSIYVDPESESDPITQRVLAHFDDKLVQIATLPDRSETDMLTDEEFASSKETLYLTRYKGRFFKRCPGATQKKALTCCNYYILNLGQQCNMNCSYCYLQSYLNIPALMIYTNGDEALAELREVAATKPGSPVRIGTGEVIDSLSLDPLTRYSGDLIELCNEHPQFTVEFKTKSDQVDQFVDLKHSGNVVVSWSVNPQFVITSEEHGTASLEQRFLAAEKCVAKGFPISFHIDPMIWHPEWKANYLNLVDQICDRFSPEQFHAISVGSLRFQPKQRHLMRRRFGAESLVVQAEMHPTSGGKLRYDAQLRATMNKAVIDRFREKSPDWKIFMCMETPENWISSFGSLPSGDPNLKNLFRPSRI